MISYTFETPLGEMVALGDESALCVLGFSDQEKVSKVRDGATEGTTSLLLQVERELGEYFRGKRKSFEVPLRWSGTPFQERAWQALLEVPYGETCSYAEQATRSGNPKAFRAVAGANGRNPISIIVPCHRIVNSGSGLGGYTGGLHRKQWLLELESAL